MLFWIFVLLLILGIGLVHVYNNKDVGESFMIVGITMSVVCTIAIIVSLISISCDHFGADATIAAKQQRYESLVYQYENDIYDNDNDLGKKELMNEIREWNEDLATKQALQDNFWVGIYYADIYDQFNFINLEHPGFVPIEDVN